MRGKFTRKIKFIMLCFMVIGIFPLLHYFFPQYKNLSLLQKNIPIETNISSAMMNDSTEKKPEYFYSIKNEKLKPRISAHSYIVGDLDTGDVILSREENKIYPIASVSKLVTAKIAAELATEKDIAVISKTAKDTYGSNGNLRVGEKLPISELIFPLLLESSNDAGVAIAEYFGSENFIKKMNEWVKKLGMEETSLEDPTGLSKENKGTAKNLFILAQNIYKEKPEIFNLTKERIHKNMAHIWLSNNQFLREDGYLGGKSGYTDPARETVVSLFSIYTSEGAERNIGIVLLQSNDRFKDVKNILKYIKENIYYGEKKYTQVMKEKENEKKTVLAPEHEQDFVKMLFGGDIMLDRGVESSVNKNFWGDYSTLFEKLEILKKADIVFANLEGPASDIGIDRKNLYSFRMDPAVIPSLKGAGVSILSIANNHIGDWGREAYLDTLVRLKENEILYTGGGNNETEAEKPIIIEKYGIKIGFLGFSDVGPEWLKVRANIGGLLMANNPRFDEIVGNASKQVDYLVVSFHFGEEYKTIHNLRQEYLAHKAIDAGAKIVVGHHPHVMQDTETYKNGFIAYSLGNFIFDQGFSENTMQGMLLEIKLERDGKISVKKNVVKLNKFFQPEKIIFGKEEKIKFEE